MHIFDFLKVKKNLFVNLLQPNILIEQVFKNVFTEVWNESKNQQSPVYESKLSGEEFILNPEQNSAR